MDRLHRALVFATAAHASVSHLREYTHEPYIIHPIEVMMLVKQIANHTEDMLIIALCHDVIEDTPFTSEDIAWEFGQDVADGVWALSDQCWEGNRKERKAAEAERLATIAPHLQTIKLADMISNTKSIVKHAPGFAVTYIKEKANLLKVMTKGDAFLYFQAQLQVEDAMRELNISV